MRIGYLSLGCKVNAYETEGMKQQLEAAGHTTVPFESVADAYIINTCTVTNMADRKSRQMLHRARKNNSDAVIIAVGCYVQEAGEQLLADKTVDIVIGNSKKNEIVSVLSNYMSAKDNKSSESVDYVENISTVHEYEELEADGTRENTRAYVKIQDGCNQFCSYCIIPYVRGRIRSRSEESICKEIERLAENGYKEVVLTGIHLSSYGLDKSDGKMGISDNTALPALIKRIAEIPAIERIRLGSLEPRIITESFAREIAAIQKVCPHFHLSLQSGCDETLKRMNRKYTSQEYIEAVDMLRKYYDNPALTTDVIVGFPGETDEDFDECTRFVKKVGFYMVHIFKYSVRQGTRAAQMPDQVDERVKTQRSDALQVEANELKHSYMESFIGKKEKVLFEEAFQYEDNEYFVGHNERYVKIAVPCKEKSSLANSCKVVQVCGFLKGDILIGEICD